MPVAFDSLLFDRNGPAEIANATGSVVYWDVILILSAAVITGLAFRTLSRKSRRDPPAEADGEYAWLEPARGECGSAARCPYLFLHEHISIGRRPHSWW